MASFAVDTSTLPAVSEPTVAARADEHEHEDVEEDEDEDVEELED